MIGAWDFIGLEEIYFRLVIRKTGISGDGASLWKARLRGIDRKAHLWPAFEITYIPGACKVIGCGGQQGAQEDSKKLVD